MPSSATVYFDTNVFILAYEGAGKTSAPARRLLAAVETGAIAAATSAVTLAETLAGAFKAADRDLADLYRTILADGPGFTLQPIDLAVLERAALLRAAYDGLKLPDAIHLATALCHGCTHLATADRRLPVPDGLDRVLVEEAAVDLLLGSLP
ncbi:PIN domain-containing protein [Chthonobacter rhizosphaerae]|uniref:PIN domain-containing protein n=1 Tax=Chthonobacter rhizosphaerae TaxID=2735553 RepID=UPI0015EFB015